MKDQSPAQTISVLLDLPLTITVLLVSEVCKVVPTPLVSEKMKSAWAASLLDHKRKTRYGRWRSSKWIAHTCAFCLCRLSVSPKTQSWSGVNRGRWRGGSTQTKPIQAISSPSGSPEITGSVLSRLLSLHESNGKHAVDVKLDVQFKLGLLPCWYFNSKDSPFEADYADILQQASQKNKMQKKLCRIPKIGSDHKVLVWNAG